MSDIKNDCADLLNLLLKYSNKITMRDISHSLNNFLTPIQIKQQLLSLSIDSDSQPDEAQKVTDLGNNITKLKEYSAGLITTSVIKNRDDTSSMKDMLSQIESDLHKLGISKFCILKSRVDINISNINVDKDIIKVLLLIFIIETVVKLKSTEITAIGTINESRNRLDLTIKSKAISLQKQITAITLIETIKSYIPLIRIIRIVESENSQLSISYTEHPTPEIQLQINLK